MSANPEHDVSAGVDFVKESQSEEFQELRKYRLWRNFG